MPAKAKRLAIETPPTIIECTENPKIWAAWFKDRETWSPWFTFLKSTFALPLDDAELATFRQCTGRSEPLVSGYTEATLCIGRRGGKSLILALIAAYLACFRDWSPFLVPGERGHITVIAADRKQAGAIFRYLKALLSIPSLAGQIERETQETVDLSNRITVEILTTSYRSVRGRTIVAALCDELAFWRTDEDTANPDSEIIAALKPAMATVPGAIMLKASSPYSRRGVLWDDHQKHFGKDTPTLVWQADTRTMNPTVSEAFIAEEVEKDPASAAAEYGAQFRTDLEAFVSREVVEACTMNGRFEIPPIAGVSYSAWIDPSGGSADSMTLSIASKEGDKIIIHAIREVVPPFAPSSIVKDFCDFLKTYGIITVTGDRYAGMWPREQFQNNGIAYRVAEWTASDGYTAFLPLLNSRRIELLDHKKMKNQLIGLERRTSQGGKDAIGHSKGAHDDVINAVACSAVVALRSENVGEFFFETLVRSPQAVAREKAEQEQLESQGSVGLPTRFNTPEFAPRDMQSIGPDYFVGGHWR
jgi:hypothetical protein